MSKLTLSIDHETIETAKKYAALHDTSVSRLVRRFLKGLQEDREKEFFARFHNELKHEGYSTPTGDVDDMRKRHVRCKYL